MTTVTGYKQDTEGAYIDKDRLARLFYTMDWREWLPPSTTITAVSYSHNSRVNDASPLVIHTQGVQTGEYTFAEISGGTLNKLYTVTAQITLDNGQIDRRAFRIKIQNRIAE
jgi:hypothetical protein